MADENPQANPPATAPEPYAVPQNAPHAPPSQITLVEATKKVRAAKAPKKKPAAKLVMTKTDGLILKAVQAGQSIGQFAAGNNLDLDTLEKRVAQLARHKFVVRNDSDPQYLHLGMAGLEHLTKIEERKTKKRSKTESQTQAPVVPTLSAPSPKHEPAKPVEIKPAIQHHVTEYEEEERDLIELMQEERKKAEASGQLKNKRSPIADSKALKDMPFKTETTPNPIISGKITTTPVFTPPTQAARPTPAPTAAASEACEVCKSPFKTSIREPALAKFANCVCGAPFHQDCYDGTIDTGDGKCPRCARKLKPVLGRGANDALSDIKDAFE